VLAIPGKDFMALLESRADLSLSVTKLVGLRRQRIETRLRNILFLPTRPRLIRVLVELVETHGERIGTRHATRFPLSHQDFAGLIGVSRETLTLTLSQLQAEGLAIERRRVVLLDLDPLRQSLLQPADRLEVKQRTKTTPT